MTHPDKERVRQVLLEKLQQDCDLLLQVVQAAKEATTHEDARSEGKYDTRAIEAGYLAGAQAVRLKELQGKRQLCQQMSFAGASETVKAGMLVALNFAGVKKWVLLTKSLGGEQVEVDGHRVQVITISSPLGQELSGLEVGDTLESNDKEAEVLAIC